MVLAQVRERNGVTDVHARRVHRVRAERDFVGGGWGAAAGDGGHDAGRQPVHRFERVHVGFGARDLGLQADDSGGRRHSFEASELIGQPCRARLSEDARRDGVPAHPVARRITGQPVQAGPQRRRGDDGGDGDRHPGHGRTDRPPRSSPTSRVREGEAKGGIGRKPGRRGGASGTPAAPSVSVAGRPHGGHDTHQQHEHDDRRHAGGHRGDIQPASTADHCRRPPGRADRAQRPDGQRHQRRRNRPDHTRQTPARKGRSGQRPPGHAESPQGLRVIQLLAGLPEEDQADQHDGGYAEQSGRGQRGPPFVGDGTVHGVGGEAGTRVRDDQMELVGHRPIDDRLGVGAFLQPERQAGLVPHEALGAGALDPPRPQEHHGLDDREATVGPHLDQAVGCPDDARHHHLGGG